jgi:hypothetical protein
LPYPVVEAVAHHHHPRRAPASGTDMVLLVHVSDLLANEREALARRSSTGIRHGAAKTGWHRGALAGMAQNCGGRAHKSKAISRLNFHRHPLQWNPESPAGVSYPGAFPNC